MRTCGLSYQIKGPATVKVAETGFNRKIVNIHLQVPELYMIMHKCLCKQFLISIIITSIT